MSSHCENWGLIIRRLMPKAVKRELTPSERKFRDAVVDSADWLAYNYGWKHVEVLFGRDGVDIAYTSHGKAGLTYVHIPVDFFDGASNEGLRRVTRKVSDAIENESRVRLCHGMYVNAKRDGDRQAS